MADCPKCGKKLNILNTAWFDDGKMCNDCYKRMDIEREEETRRLEEEQRVSQEMREQAIAKVVLTTGDIKQPYEILDAIITVTAHQAGYFDSANPSSAFDSIKTELRAIAHDMGADAIVHCQFEYRVGAEQGLLSGYLGSKQFVEIFAYGTAVKLKNDTPELTEADKD